MISSRFIYNLNNNLKRMDDIEMKMATGRKFFRPSDDPVAAARSLQVRRNLSKIVQYQSNSRDARAWLKETETAMNQIKDIIQNAQELNLQGANGSMSDSDRQAVAKAIENLQGQLVQVGNANLAGRYVLGGYNTTTPPFTVDENGKLLYNNMDLDDTTLDFSGPSHEVIIYDLGSPFTVSFPGSVIFGYGKDSNGLPENLYSILGDIKDILNSGSGDIQPYIGKLQEKLEDILAHMVDVGERTKHLDFIDNRLEDEYLNYRTVQADVEGLDQEKAIIEFKMQEAVYRSALAIGARIIQPSLVDFLR